MSYYLYSLSPWIQAKMTPVAVTAEAAESFDQKFEVLQTQIHETVIAGEERETALVITEKEVNSKLVEVLAEGDLPFDQILVNFREGRFLIYAVADVPGVAARTGAIGRIQVVNGDLEIVIEDFDSSFLTNSQKIMNPNDLLHVQPQKQNIITYSNLLNILDGLSSSYGHILFLTTNHIDKIQDSLIRPGRIDLVEYVGYIETNDITEYFDYFYSNQLKEDKIDSKHEINQLATDLLATYSNITMSELQNYFIKFRGNYKDSFVNIKRFKEDNNTKNLSGINITNEVNETDIDVKRTDD